MNSDFSFYAEPAVIPSGLESDVSVIVGAGEGPTSYRELVFLGLEVNGGSIGVYLSPAKAAEVADVLHASSSAFDADGGAA